MRPGLQDRAPGEVAGLGEVVRTPGSVAEELRGYLTGWRNYFGLAETPKVLGGLDKWIRLRLRMLQLKQWKRGVTAYRELKRLGSAEAVALRVAANMRRWARNSRMNLNMVLSITYYDALGVPRLAR